VSKTSESDMQSAAAIAVPLNPHLRQWLKRAEERKAWEAANPFLAEAWNDALREDEERQRRADQDVFKLKALERLPEVLVKLGVPLRCAEVVSSPRDSAALKAAREWMPLTGSRWLLLMGGVGTGKSVAGAFCVREAIAPRLTANPLRDSASLRRTALFVRAAELARTTLSDYSAADRAAFEEWAAAELLVIDDLGAERLWDGWMARLDELLDRRYGDKLRTIITTNLDGAAFKERYGTRISDRIRHDGDIVISGADSLRQRGLGL
jgi:DNA replication protein DnaC